MVQNIKYYFKPKQSNVDAQFLEGSKDNIVGYFMFGMTFHVVEDVNKLIQDNEPTLHGYWIFNNLISSISTFN